MSDVMKDEWRGPAGVCRFPILTLLRIILQDPRQEKTIIALQELHDQLRSGARPRRPSGLTITDHVGPTKERASW